MWNIFFGGRDKISGDDYPSIFRLEFIIGSEPRRNLGAGALEVSMRSLNPFFNALITDGRFWPVEAPIM